MLGADQFIKFFFTRDRNSETWNKVNWTAGIPMKLRCDHRSCNRNLTNDFSPKTIFRTSTEFKPMASALALQCSTDQKPLWDTLHWRVIVFTVKHSTKLWNAHNFEFPAEAHTWTTNYFFVAMDDWLESENFYLSMQRILNRNDFRKSRKSGSVVSNSHDD